MQKMPATGFSHFIPFIMIFTYCNDPKELNIIESGAASDLLWRFGSKQMGFTPQKIKHVRPNCLAPNFKPTVPSRIHPSAQIS
jgi:hypothetical protein